jgi:outer membrane autotransporter protein
MSDPWSRRDQRLLATRTAYQPSTTYQAIRQSQLPPLWQQSLIDNARLEARRLESQRRLKTLSFSVATALVAGAFARPGAVHAVDYNGTITGVAEHDRDGGSGGYDPGYDIAIDDDGTLHYAFADGDRVALEGVDVDLHAMSVTRGNPPVVLDVAGGGWLELSAIRGESTVRGSAVGILNDGNTVTVNGNTRISTNADDTDHGMSLGNSAQAVIGRGGSTTVFNGATDFHARTQGFARGVWAEGGSTITFNGPTTILAESRGTLDAVYNSQGSNITFNGDTTISALSIWPSDNAHAIYNDNTNSVLTVNGNLSLTTVAAGSTAFGVRNQGDMEVFGDATVSVTGTRSAHGISNQHRNAWMIWHGDVDVRVFSEGNENGYAPFGNPSGLNNDRSPGALMRFEGAVNVDVTSEAETYGLVSSGHIEFTSPTAPVSFTVTAICNPPDHPDCDRDRDVYGIRNFGTVNVAGGLTVSTSPFGTGTAYSIWSVPLDIQDASVTVNQAGGQRVQLDGDIATATDPVNGNTGSVDVNFDTADSWLRGLVGGVQNDAGYSVGRADLTFANGAAWMPQGAGTLSNDVGAGTLTLANGGTIDMAAHWGGFEPGAVPAHGYRTLVIDSSTGNGTVALGDGARFHLLSDITGQSGTATADRIVFGGGISNFSATGAQGIAIVYDPVLDDTSWVNQTTLSDGTTIPATTPIVIVDASAAAGGAAAFAAVAGLDRQWSGTFENALVQFTYTPQVELDADGSTIMLTGIEIQGSGDGDGDNGGDGDSGGDGDAPDIDIRPSETVLTAAEAVDSALNLWTLAESGSQRRMQGLARDHGDAQAGGVWARVDGGRLTADAAYARNHQQDYTGVTIGADRRFALDAGDNYTGISAGRIRGNADYTSGDGELTGTSFGLYSTWIFDSSAYVLVGADTASLENLYAARDSTGAEIRGRYRTRAHRLHAEGGFPIHFAQDWYIEPQVGLSVGRVNGSEHTTSNGVLVRHDDYDASYVRAGVAIGRTLQGQRLRGDVYARAAARQDFGDDPRITASRDGGSIVPDTVDRTGAGGEFALGANLGVGKRAGVFFEASRATGNGTERDWGAQAGVRFNW